MISSSEVDAVLVTHKHVDLGLIKETLQNFRQVIVWDNELGPNLGPFGQFVAASFVASSSVVYFQDDDCVTNPEAIVAAWEPGKIVCNMGRQGHAENYKDKLDKLMGFGSCFERSLIKPTFEKYWSYFKFDYVTWREPGRIFTAMNRYKVKVVEVECRNLPWATSKDRLYLQSEHNQMAKAAINRVIAIISLEERTKDA